jgi:hypothetical protein
MSGRTKTKKAPRSRVDRSRTRSNANIKANDRSHLENLLDEALKETFPASDALSITRYRPQRKATNRTSAVAQHQSIAACRVLRRASWNFMGC